MSNLNKLPKKSFVRLIRKLSLNQIKLCEIDEVCEVSSLFVSGENYSVIAERLYSSGNSGTDIYPIVIINVLGSKKGRANFHTTLQLVIYVKNNGIKMIYMRYSVEWIASGIHQD